MDAKHVNAIMKGTRTIITSHLGLEAKMLKPYLLNKKSIPSNEISVILGLKGQLEGQLICSMQRKTAIHIISKMMGGMTVEDIDSIGWSAIQEFGNWVAGHTATELSNVNCIIDVTPPVVNEGDSNYHASQAFITLPMQTSVGDIHVHVSVKNAS